MLTLKYSACNRTIVDAAREWVEHHAAEHPALASALADCAVMKRARGVTWLWRRATEVRVAQLRKSIAIRAIMNRSHVRRRLAVLCCVLCRT